MESSKKQELRDSIEKLRSKVRRLSLELEQSLAELLVLLSDDEQTEIGVTDIDMDIKQQLTNLLNKN